MPSRIFIEERNKTFDFIFDFFKNLSKKMLSSSIYFFLAILNVNIYSLFGRYDFYESFLLHKSKLKRFLDMFRSLSLINNYGYLESKTNLNIFSIYSFSMVQFPIECSILKTENHLW